MDFMNTSIIDLIINLKYETNISIYSKEDNSIMFIITYTDDEIFEKTIFKEWLKSNYGFYLENVSLKDLNDFTIDNKLKRLSINLYV